jgi:lon-related putative ATP-dependent protease
LIKELDYTELKMKNITDGIDMNVIEASDKIVGQTKGAEALKFGLGIKNKGYNIYVSGLPGTGRTTFTEKFAKEVALNDPVPPDMCYVHNFKNPKEPMLLTLDAGKGKLFREDMEELIVILSNELPKRFNDRAYDDEKSQKLRLAQKKKDEIIKKLTADAKEFNFSIKMSNNGIYFLPIVDGETMDEESFEELSDEVKDSISEVSDEVQDLCSKAMKKIKEIDKKNKEAIDAMDYNLALFTVGHYFVPLQEKYSDNKAVSEYLALAKESILSNPDDFLFEDDSEGDDPLSMVMPWMVKRPNDDVLIKYKVNLIVDNSEQVGAPVIINYNPTYTNLIGEVEYDNENGNFVTDFMKIKPGIFHKANGGYIVFQMHDLLNNFYAWETLRRVLKTGELIIEPIKEYQFGNISVTSIQPQAAHVNFKVILIGSNYHYELLNEFDDEFSKLFKVTSIFDYEMPNTAENVKAVIGFLKDFAKRKNILDFDMSATNVLIEYSSRSAENQNKLTTAISRVKDILIEADSIAKSDGKDIITAEYIKKAIVQSENRVNIYQQKYISMITDGEIMIDTEGSEVGQINGLCVLDTGKHTFGMPTRITASSYLGKAGIVNIEKEAEMSGAIHDKGIQVLTGYFGTKYAQSFPLSFSSRICFEQSYNGVDGDSASSTETYALVSSLSGIPINQSLAVTGSMNQKGKIQPIGGVSYKIEGFFEVCKARGLTGKQGVIIPKQNEKDLTLKDEVIDSVKDGKFHIYSITDIDDGIELLMNKKAGEINNKGNYPRGSVHYSVMKKLKEYYNLANATN